jgi:SAM-dependent methyltransferase
VTGNRPGFLACSCGVTSLTPFPSASGTAELYQENYYQEATGERFLTLAERFVVALRGLRVKAILRRQPGPGRILDLGCGRGELLELFERQGWKAMGTQISQTAAEAARALRGVDVRLGELPQMGLEGASFDVITAFHVVEHLQDPALYLREARRLIRPGGLLLVEVPNLACPGFRLLGTRDLCFDYPHHLFFFTPDSLGGLLGEAGFKVEEISHFSLEYSPFTTLQNLLNVLPGRPNRLYQSLMNNRESLRLRKQPLTWLHWGLAAVLGLPALVLALAGLALPIGNTIRLYCRPSET